MAPEIVGSRHALAALGLELANFDHRAVAAGNPQALLVQLDGGAGGLIGGFANQNGLVDFEFGAAKLCGGDGPGVQATDLIVDALGGVEVDVPYRMKYSDPYQNLYIDLQPGLQTLNGNKAEQFIRFRADYVEGDIGRVDAQKIFISACITKVKSSFNVSTIAAIAEQVMQYVKTDIPLQDLVYYAKKALSVDLDKMTMLTLPGIQGRQYDTSGTWYYIAYRDGTLSAINKYFNSYNFEVTANMFDKNHALYDEAGTYMHSIFLTQHTEEESYTADDVSDIHISKYTNKPSTTTTTAATTKADPQTSPTVTTENSNPSQTTETTVEGGVHTETAAPTETTAPTEGVETTTHASVSGEEMTTDEPQPKETTVVEVTEEVTEPEEPTAPAEPMED